MKKSFAIIGLGRFGLSLLEELAKFTDDIIAIDTDEEAVKKASLLVNQAFIMDSTNERALKSVGIQNVDHAIISFGSKFEASILTYATLKNFNINHITIRVDNDQFIPIYEKLGATDIISPQKIAGDRLANRIISDNFTDYFKLIGDYSVVETLISQNIEPVSIIDLDVRNKFDVNILLIMRDKKEFAPKATDLIQTNDIIFVFGKSANILKFANFMQNPIIKKEIKIKDEVKLEEKSSINNGENNE